MEVYMNKVIHYCWFGSKPIPELTKKCIKSWKKYLPDFEIKICNESNFDINSCEFVKQAYEAGKWAFVSDYARLTVLYNDGGIYFDTDMEVLSNIDFLKDKEFFVGREYSGYIAAGVIGVKSEKNEYIKEMLDYYKSIKHFDTQNLFDYAIPKIITKVLEKYEHITKNGIEIYNNDCYVYPVDYFYPISYDRSTKYYSYNTCMVHYYYATWIPKKERITLSLYRTIGKKNTKRLCSLLRGVKQKCIRLNNLSIRGYYYLKKYIGINFNSSRIFSTFSESAFFTE
jgi:mannosyltransferase OCH1-like enzyme